MKRARVANRLILVALTGSLGSGCYEGVSGVDASGEDSGASTGTANSGEGPDGSSGGGGSTGGDSGEDAEPVETERWRRLTATQYRNSVQSFLGVDVDTSGFLADIARGDSPFPSNAGIAPQAIDIDIYWNTAIAVSEQAIQDVPGLLDGCDPETQGASTCGAEFIERLGRRAFRRPLTESQSTALQELFETGLEDSVERGLELVIQAVLQSPQFLYVVEYGEPAGPGQFQLDGYEVATRLAFLLTNTSPDDTLLAAAEQLDDPQERLRQAERLMQTDAFMDALVDVHLELTHISRLDEVSRSDLEFDEALRDSMTEEAERFIREVMVEDGTVEGLFTTPLAFPDARLAEDVYGFGGDGARVEVQDGTRVGLLTLPAFLASSPPLETNFEVVYRGNAVRTRLLCDTLPPPAVDVDSEQEDGLSARERLRRHQEDPACSTCHVLMDNIGFGLLNYDDLGRYLAEDDEGPIDASGYILSDEEVGFDDAAGLSEALGVLPQVRECMTTQLFRLALARDPDAADGESLARVNAALSEGGGDIRTALLELVASQTFALRRGE